MNNLYNQFKIKQLFDSPLIMSFIVNFILFGLIFLFLNPRYQINDDVEMMMIASGFHTGSPSEYLVFINIFIGLMLKYLYLYFSFINWYSILLYFMHFIAMVSLLYVILNRKNRRLGLLLYLFIFAIFELFLQLYLTFTTTAFVLFIGGIILFIFSLEYRPTKKRLFIELLSGILILFAALIRTEMLVLGFFLAFPILVYYSIAGKIKRILTYVLIVVSLFFIFNYWNINYYSKNVEWIKYLEIINIRGELTDYPIIKYNEKTKNVFDRLSWSKNDVQMFLSLFYSDKILYSLNNLKSIYNAFRAHRSIYDVILVFFKSVFKILPMVLSALIFIIFTSALLEKNKKIVVLSCAIMLFAFSIWLSYAFKFPARILLPMLFYLCTVALFFINDDSVNNIKYSYVYVVICLVMSLVYCGGIYYLNKQNMADAEVFSRMINILNHSKEKIFVVWAEGLPFEKMSAFSDIREYRNFKMIPIGWSIDAPYINHILKTNKIDNLYTSLYQMQNIFLVCRTDQQYEEIYKRFIWEHYKIRVQFKEVENFDKAISISNTQIKKGLYRVYNVCLSNK